MNNVTTNRWLKFLIDGNYTQTYFVHLDTHQTKKNLVWQKSQSLIGSLVNDMALLTLFVFGSGLRAKGSKGKLLSFRTLLFFLFNYYEVCKELLFCITSQLP